MSGLSVIMDAIGQVLIERARGADIDINAAGGMALATAHAQRLDALKDFDRSREPMKVEHFYVDLDSGTLDSVWVVGDVQESGAVSFLWGTVDAIVGAAPTDYSLGSGNGIWLAHRYGEDAVVLLGEIVRQAALHGTSREWRRWSRDLTDDEGEPTGAEEFARLDTDDASWHDEGIYAQHCAPDDEGATLITLLDLDDGMVEAFNELIERKDAAAAVARRVVVEL